MNIVVHVVSCFQKQQATEDEILEKKRIRI